MSNLQPDLGVISLEEWLKNEQEYLQLLKQPNILQSLPDLNNINLDQISDQKLVRFKGMIQDMHGPEYYIEKYEVLDVLKGEKSWMNGKYLDTILCKDGTEVDLNNPLNVTSERHCFVVISTPALNEWVKSIELEKNQTKPKNSNETKSNPNSTSKRPLDEDTEMEVEPPSTSTSESQKKLKNSTISEPNQSNPTGMSAESLLNFPLPNPGGKSCHVKVYSNFNDIKLNQLVEFVGFLSLDPILASNEDEEMQDMEKQTHFPPPSLIPRLHCVWFQQLSHDNPLIEAGNSMDLDKIKLTRNSLMIVLTQLLLGDKLAAEYLLYHMISKVYMRKDFMALGQFSLNLSNIPLFEHLDYVSEIYKFLQLFLTKSHYLPMTLDNLNNIDLVPKKDYESNRITSGVLQLSSNTHLILDETVLAAGKFNEIGVKNIRAINSTIKDQKITYDFNFYSLDFDCDLPVLICSQGKSVISTNCHVKLHPEEVNLNTFEEILAAARFFLKPDVLNDIRMYLTLARFSDYNLDDEGQKIIEEEFVKMRQNDGKVTADDLHNLLVLSRMVSLSYGKHSLDLDSWKIACELEKERKSRLAR